MKLMVSRHSVRSYTDKKIPEDIVEKLRKKIESVNEESGLNFKLVTDEPVAFGGFLPKYGSFKNVKNYIICAGENVPDFDEQSGYYGEELVLYCQELGLNSCWVGLTVNKKKVKEEMKPGETLGCVIAIGYSSTQGVPHKNKDVAKVTSVPAPWPAWFKNGVKGAMLAPTAVNSQRFKISLSKDGKVIITAGRGPYAQVDLGIVKYQFMLGAGPDFPGFA